MTEMKFWKCNEAVVMVIEEDKGWGWGCHGCKLGETLRIETFLTVLIERAKNEITSQTEERRLVQDDVPG
ncbi:hypothetical protein CHARACLAT_007183 [Characodon lateralis]|uniref:Uncharacterized protein n=1 Tax=Characodon lateralis TaxID=208331 RepID=A0ABU7EHA8_9TELE|nr:hypothetical protein [Characodon lateralis]